MPSTNHRDHGERRSQRHPDRAPTVHDPEVLDRRRVEAGLNWTDLAARAGITKGWMSEIANGHKSPSAPVLKRLADVFGCEPRDLMRQLDRASS